MQLVFVHGVNNRRDTGGQYDAGVRNRQNCFRDWSIKGEEVTFYDPYWGQFGAHPDRDLVSIPSGPDVAFGGISDDIFTDFSNDSLEGDLLLQAARKDFNAILNTLALRLIESQVVNGNRIAELIADYAADLDELDNSGIAPPAWLNDIDSDEEFLATLEAEIHGVADEKDAAMGLQDLLKDAGKWVVRGIINIVDGPAEKLIRKFTPQIARFLGDVFIYLKQDERREQIREVISLSLVEAAKKTVGKQKLIVIGHSMGAIILYDILSDPQMVSQMNDRIGHELKIDLFLSVGTQIGLFEEMDLFGHSIKGVSPGKPSCVVHWWHVYNVMDVLSFGVNGVIDNVKQFSVNTKANIVDAHGAYFNSPVFHKRLRKRLIHSRLL